MADNYYGTCAMCEYFDLYDKNGIKFKCTYRDTYYPWNEPQCRLYFKPARPVGRYTRTELVDMAREHRLP